MKMLTVNTEILGFAALLVLLVGTQIGRAETEGETIGRNAFEISCAGCHGANPVPRAINRDQLSKLPPEHILQVITEGIMIIQGASLNTLQKRALATYLSETPWGSVPQNQAAEKLVFCEANPLIPIDALSKPNWNGWGLDAENTHFQPATHAGLDKTQIDKLELRWAFGFPGATTIATQPVIAGGKMYVGSPTQGVYALDPKTGCAFWKYDTRGPVRAAFTIAPRAGKIGSYDLYVGDRKGWAYGLDAQTGELIWELQLDEHPASLITASPVLHDGYLYMPTASLEELSGASPVYECCTFRGSVSKVEAATGKLLWKTYVIPEEPIATKKTARGTQMYGPSGAGIWSAPTIDTKLGVLYVTTGDSYSPPAAAQSDSVVAIDLETGEILWWKQTLANDWFTAGCIAGGADPEQQEGCGPDLDYGSPAILRSLPTGKRLLLAGQKSGVLHALDPDNRGELVWETRLSPGGVLGGIEWGFAADEKNVYIPISDVWETGSTPENAGGVHAVTILDGKPVWHVPAEAPQCVERPGCNAGQPQAATLIPGVLFSGSMDGVMRAYDATTGEVIWKYDTNRDFKTVNGVKASGGSINGAGVTVVDGWIYFPTGYGLFGMPGNGFLAFGPPSAKGLEEN